MTVSSLIPAERCRSKVHDVAGRFRRRMEVRWRVHTSLLLDRAGSVRPVTRARVACVASTPKGNYRNPPFDTPHTSGVSGIQSNCYAGTS